MLLSVFPVCVVPVILPWIKVLLGSKRQARIFWGHFNIEILLQIHRAILINIALCTDRSSPYFGAIVSGVQIQLPDECAVYS